MTWEAIKLKGSKHYKTGGVEPIDLYRAAGCLKEFALCSIIKYAFRSLTKRRIDLRDIEKIIHYAEIVREGG
jgi:hypothetical protein